jgi:multisubunit Na+/H+ antiporter MnhC subunit
MAFAHAPALATHAFAPGAAAVGARPARFASVPVARVPARTPTMLFGFGKKKASSAPASSGPNPYRALGVAENATYDDVEAAVKRLSIKYADDRKKLMMLDVHKDRIFEDRLQQRMSGALTPKIKDSPYDLKPKPKKRFVIPEWAQGVVKLPDLAYIRRTAIIMGIFILLGFVTPTLAGSCMGMAFIAGAGFLYNRGLPEPVKDEYGGIGEVRPVKHSVVLKTLVINFTMAATFFGLGQLYMLYLPLPLWCPPDSFVNAAVVIGLWVSCLFFQAQDPADVF